MSDPRTRLERTIPGEWAHAPRAVTVHMLERAVPPPAKKQLVPPREYELGHKVRDIRNTREPGPYAPQMIRLVRHPYALSPAGTVRQKGSERSMPTRPERLPFEVAFREALATWQPAEFPKPTDVHPPHVRRERPSAAAYLASTGGAP